MDEQNKTGAAHRFPNLMKRWLLFLIAANAAIVAAVLVFCYQYISAQERLARQNAVDSFVSNVNSIQNLSAGFIRDQQQACDDWRGYINARRLTVDEALAFLRDANSAAADGIMAHIVDYDTWLGYSSAPDGKGGYAVDYAYFEEEFSEIVNNVRRSDKAAGTVFLTRTFTNPINAMPAVGFCQDIRLYDGGEEKPYLLLRIVPLSLINERWHFPTDYSSAEISLITADGNYIVRSASLKYLNFWEYIRTSNNLSYPEADAVKQSCISGEQTVFIQNNSMGESCYYVCLRAEDNSDWYFIGYIPSVAITGTLQIDLTVAYVVACGFLAMLLLDGACLLNANRRLIRSAEEVRRANMAKTQFLSSMSHDIRTPMNAIIGMTTIASRHPDDPSVVKECLEKITLASNHLLTLVNDVLDISKVESGRLTLNPGVFSLAECVGSLVNITRPQVREKDLEFEVHIHGIDHEYIYADELRINQIFINILSNAVKYTNPGGRITIDLEERPCAGDKRSVELVYSVSDTGIGMTKEFMEHMYDTFTRATDSRIDNIQGSGLGLAITKRTVDLMSGTIDCESEPGKGTKFTVTLTLPLAEHMTDELMLPPLSMLVVDDDEIFLETAKDTLSDMGVDADLADSGKKAVQMAAERHKKGRDYPVIIIDWKMPEMDGLETTRAIRAEVGDEVPIIIISAYDWVNIENKALEAGANGFISKPLFRSTLYAKLNEFLHFADSADKPQEGDNAEDLAGMNLLIAEDNDINWEIISELLAMVQITTTRAENGQICIDRLKEAAAGTYQAILMDIQMPVMNGRAAAEAIRALDDESRRHIPIIAMTADAYAEDVQACLQAGMNGHVAKPIDLNKLYKELRKVKAGAGK